VKSQPLKKTPALIAAFVILLVSLAAISRLDLFERVEAMTYDWRVRMALNFPTPVSTNLAFARIDDDTIHVVKSGELGYKFGLYWPRQIHGRVVNELSQQGAEGIAFDILFGELREDHKPVLMGDGETIESDKYFADELRRASNVILATTTNLSLPVLFLTNAAAVGHISTDKDSDGILRRAKAFTRQIKWHPEIVRQAGDPRLGLNLNAATNKPGEIFIPFFKDPEHGFPIELDAKNNFTIPSPDDATPARVEKAFTYERVWHMGIVLAARHLKLDLANAEINFDAGHITLTNASGLKRIIPVDREGFFYVDWAVRPEDVRLAQAPVQTLLRQNRDRISGRPVESKTDWRGKLVVIGSSAQGNDLTDMGATPLDKSALLVSKHWNVANSILTDRFIHRAGVPAQVAIIIIIGLVTALLSLKLRVVPGLIAVLALAAIYSATCLGIYVQQRLWLPMVLPLVGALFVQYAMLVTYRALFEQREQRRVKAIFSKVVSPNIAKELLGRENLLLGGTRCELTVLFADVRGFTELTDTAQEQVEQLIRTNKLDAAAAEAVINESARETLDTVNTYLALVADTVKQHDGTLDKYIGDCVMAFWGAPTPQSQHALNCVRAAIDAQRALDGLNKKRMAENTQRETENKTRTTAGLAPKPMLPILALGTGINTGSVTAGLMGSTDHIFNYTVFGREVNLASRLEGVSGRGRIIIGEATYAALSKDDPALAARCIEQEPTRPKGFQKAVRNFEVPWQS
jgi:class 3 adenylate cyclase/CHASE2 domain-containing sensor protein